MLLNDNQRGKANFYSYYLLLLLGGLNVSNNAKRLAMLYFPNSFSSSRFLKLTDPSLASSFPITPMKL